MIPVKLALRNFMSYTDVHEPLVFEGIHLACLSGENGAGKSTLLDAMTWALWGYSRAGAGSAQQLVHAGRTEMEVEYEFKLAGETYRVVRKWTAPRSGRGAGTSLLDLSGLMDRRVASLSGGERQRVAMARALHSAPDVLLLDEPLAAVDLARRRRILDALLAVRDDLHVPIVYVTHSPEEARAIADYALVMDEGQVVAAGAPNDVLP